MPAPADSLPTVPQIKGVAVSWGLTDGPKFTGHLQQSASLDDAFKTTEEYQDTDGITQSFVFSDAMTEGSFELIVKDGTPLPAPSSTILEVDTGNTYLLMTRGRQWTNNGVSRCTYTIKRGQASFFT